MKKRLLVMIWLMGTLLYGHPAGAQVQELEQLALNIEKLAQFKQMLSDMKKGYEILSGGYNTIKKISQGNFELHKVFLDGLAEVSPAVRNYKRVADIISNQIVLVHEYKTALNRYKKNPGFNAKEIDYIVRVYSNLLDLSVKDLDDLFTVLTAKRLRMSDDERLAAIDRIDENMADKLMFLRSFNNSTDVLALQRIKESREIKHMQQLYGQ